MILALVMVAGMLVVMVVVMFSMLVVIVVVMIAGLLVMVMMVMVAGVTIVMMMVVVMMMVMVILVGRDIGDLKGHDQGQNWQRSNQGFKTSLFHFFSFRFS